MTINLDYGKKGLRFNLPEDLEITLVEPNYIEKLSDPIKAIKQALHRPIKNKPLVQQINPSKRVAVVFSDITRPTPNNIILPVILNELEKIGVPENHITLFNATGTHRINTRAELEGMLGNDIVRKYRIIQNDAHDRNTHILIGRTKNGNEIQLNREFLNCEQKILTGLIEPHFFAGYSGGGKAVMPGLASIETVIHNHSAINIDHPMATWGITVGNPIWEDIREAALMTEPVFLLNVTLNRKKQITGVFAGDIDKAYEKGCRFVRDNVMIPVRHSFDVVITSNSGYPLDLNLYQCVKGMSAAFQVVKPGGSIIIAGECWDGIPEHGSYGKLLRSVSNPDELLNKIRSPGFYEADMWQAQIQALICQQAEVYVYSTGLSENQIRDAMLKPCKSIEDTVNKLREKYGNSMSICILPEGPQTIPYIRNSQTRKQSKKV